MRYNYKSVKSYIESEYGYKLLSNTYKTCKEKIKIKCNKNHIFEMTFDKFKNSNTRCPICNTGGKFKYSLEYTQQLFKKYNCKLLSNIYINCDTPMDYICKCGNKSKISLKMFQEGQRCYDCRNQKISEILKRPFEDVFNLFKNNGCELLTTEDEYKNNNKNIKNTVKYKCSCGHISKTTVERFKSGCRCKNCQQDRTKKTSLEKYGVDYVLKDKGVRTKIRQSLYQNGTAPCSKQQRYIHSIIGGELNYPVRTLSLDIAFPEEMIYFEYDGGLHDGNVKFGTLTQTEFNEKEKSRNYALLRSGWKEIRLISRKDYIPTTQKLLEIIEISKDYLNSGRHYIKFDVDNSTIINSRGNFEYDFGKLRTV